MQENHLLSLRFLSRQHLIPTSLFQHPQWLTVIKRLTQLIKVSLPMPAHSGQQISAAAPPACTPPTSPTRPATCRWRSPRPASPRTSPCPSPRRSCARGSGSSRSTACTDGCCSTSQLIHKECHQSRSAQFKFQKCSLLFSHWDFLLLPGISDRSCN